MIEDELRAAFARHEDLTPDPTPLRGAIAEAVVRRRRRRRLLRGTASALAVMLAVGAPVVARTVSGGDGPAPTTGQEAAGQRSDPLPEGPLNFLFLGVDGWSGRETGHRADTVLMVHVPRERRQAYLISLPRDLGVEIPGHGFDKLNAAFLHGSRTGRPGDGGPDLAAGADLTARTVTALTGLRFDGQAVVTYAGLQTITDAVGGVRMCLDERVRSTHTRRVFPAGCQRLDGAAALDLLRQRRNLPQGAHDRDRNGQRFATALVAQATTGDLLRNPARLAEVVQTIENSMTLNAGDRSLLEIIAGLRLVATAEPVGIGWRLRSRLVDGRLYEQLDPVVSAELFAALRAGTVAEWVRRHPDHVIR